MAAKPLPSNGSVAAKLGIDEVEAGVEPQYKHERVRALREGGNVVAMGATGLTTRPRSPLQR